MRPLIFLILLSNWAVAFGQENTLVLPGKLPIAQMDIGPYTSFYEDNSGDTLPLSVISRQQFRPFKQKRNERTTDSDHSLMVTWLRFSLRNTHPTDTLRVFYDCWQGEFITYYENNRRIGRGGYGLPRSAGSPNTSSILLRIPAESEYTYYVQSVSRIQSVLPIVSLLYAPEEAYRHVMENAYLEAPLLVTMALIAGSLLFMSLFALYSYRLNRDKAFLYYGLYTLFGFYLAINHVDNRFGLDMLRLPTLPSSLLIVFYALFISYLINLRQQQDRIWRVLVGLLGLVFLEEIWTSLETLSGTLFFSANAPYQYRLLPAVLVTGVLLIALIRSQSVLKKWLLAGVISLLILAFIPQILNPFVPNLPPRIEIFVNNPGFWALLGIALESLCFALALAYRSRLVELENGSLHSQYTHDLEAQLAQRTQEIEQKSHLLEQQHIRQLETEFGQKLADTEMTALRAQMNPHFIFNCLNSIKLYTLDNEADKASDYLTKFSRLIRLVLENSRSELVPLQSELEALQLYIELEAMRFKQKVQFSIRVSPQIDQRFLCIPPLLLQPYVENAIWHGLMHKLEGGTVMVEVSQPEDNLLHIEITDDGVGRERAVELKSKSAGKHKSFGMQVTADRIRMINQLYNINTQAQVTDLVDSFGEACGTRVTLDIPI